MAIRQSESLAKLAPAFVKAQAAIKTALKDADNPYFKSKYADINSVINAVKEALNDNGIAFLQFPDEAPPGNENTTGTLSLTTRLLHASGEWIEATATVPLAKDDPQGFGSAVTYARRYGLQAITGLLAEDDDAEKAVVHAKAAPRLATKSIFPGVR